MQRGLCGRQVMVVIRNHSCVHVCLQLWKCDYFEGMCLLKKLSLKMFLKLLRKLILEPES